jgi:hypothetical protein
MTDKDWIEDIESLADVDSKEHAGASRRDVLRGALGVGFAAAVLPVSASTISTPTTGLDAAEVQINVDGEDVPVYVAKPAGTRTGLPVVLVVSEIFGAHEHICDIARRFAREGYMALAPELFIRQGDPMGYANMGDLIREVIAKTPDEQVKKDLDAWRTPGLAVCGKPTSGEGWRGMVRTIGGRLNAFHTDAPDPNRGQDQRPCTGLVRRCRQGHQPRKHWPHERAVERSC